MMGAARTVSTRTALRSIPSRRENAKRPAAWRLDAAKALAETGPLVSCAHLNDELMAGTEDERTTYRIKAGVPGPLVEAAIVDTEGNFLPADGEEHSLAGRTEQTRRLRHVAGIEPSVAYFTMKSESR